MKNEHKLDQGFTKYLVDDSEEAIKQSQKQLDEINRLEAKSSRKRLVAIFVLIALVVVLNLLNLFGFLTLTK